MNRLVVVDANRIFAALIASRSPVRRILASNPEITFCCPKFVVVELFKHKEKIFSRSGLPETDLLEALYTLLQRIHFVDEDVIPIGSWAEGWRLCREIDEKDVAYVALALELDAELWTEDRELRSGLVKRGFDRFFSPQLDA